MKYKKPNSYKVFPFEYISIKTAYRCFKNDLYFGKKS